MKIHEKENKLKVAIYGGNGFVGTYLAKEFAARNIGTVCLSRSGYKPLHLKDEEWSETVRWCKGDATEPKLELLSTVDVIIVSVGSPPIPTLSKEAYEHQVFMNGTTNANLIRAAGEAGVKRVIVMGASIPLPMRSDKFGYTKGKRLAYDAAKAFSELSKQHRAVVLQPGAIFGTRHLANGWSIPLGAVMKPLSYIMPWQFIDVEKIAQRVVNEALDNDADKPSFMVLKNTAI